MSRHRLWKPCWFMRKVCTYFLLYFTSWALLPALRSQENSCTQLLWARRSTGTLWSPSAWWWEWLISPSSHTFWPKQEWVSTIPCLSLSFHMQRRCIKDSANISVHSFLLTSPSTGLFLTSCLAVTLAGHTHFSSGSCGIRGVLSYLFSILDKSFEALSWPESPRSCGALQG